MASNWNIQAAQALIERLNLAYADIARALDVNRQTVGHWFRGRGEPSVRDLKRMAKVLGVDVSELISDDAIVANDETERSVIRDMRTLDAKQRELLQIFLAGLKAGK